MLFVPWILNPSGGPSPIVLQTVLALGAGLLWFVLPPSSRGHPPADAVALAWLAAATANAVIAIAQYFGAVDESYFWISAASYGEAYGNLRQRNQLATLLALGLASAFYGVAITRGRLTRLFLGLAVVLISAACALTSSRTGLLQWLILCGLVFVMPWRGGWQGWRLWSALALGSYFLALATLPALATWWTGQAPTTLMDRLATDLGCVSRKVLWVNALHLIGLQPWTGWGLGEMDYAHHVTLYPGARFCLIVDNAHNLFLQAAVELGIPFALGLAVLIALGVWTGRPWAERSPARLLAWAALGAVLLHSQFEYPLWYGPFELAALLSLSLLWRPARSPRAGLRLALGAVAASALAYVLWDYHRVSQLFLPEASRAAAYQSDTLAKVRGSWLFASQVDFAEFTTTALTPANAAAMADLGERVMHYSPEPQVAEKLIDALRLAGNQTRAAWHSARFAVAFPEEFAAWAKSSAQAAGAASAGASEAR